MYHARFASCDIHGSKYEGCFVLTHGSPIWNHRTWCFIRLVHLRLGNGKIHEFFEKFELKQKLCNIDIGVWG